MPSTVSIRRGELFGQLIGRTQSIRPEAINRLRRKFKQAERADGRPKATRWREFAKEHGCSNPDAGLKTLALDPPRAAEPIPAAVATPPSLEDKIASCLNKLDDVNARVSAFCTQSRRGRSVAEIEARLERRGEISEEIEGALQDAAALLAEDRPATHAVEIHAALRRLSELSVLLEFPGLAEAKRNFSVDGFAKAAQRVSSELQDPEQQRGIQDDLHILTSMLEAANRDGYSAADFAHLSAELHAYSEIWEQFALSDIALGPFSKAAAAVRELVDRVDARIALDRAVDDLFSLCRSRAEANGKPFPVAQFLRAGGLATPFLKAYANTERMTQKTHAMESLSALCTLVSDINQPCALLVGCSEQLDEALLDAKTTSAKALALSDRACEAVAARHELTKANKVLETLVQTLPRRWPQLMSNRSDRLSVQGSASGVLKDKSFLKVLLKVGGPTTARDAALLLARISHLETKTLRLEQEAFGWRKDLDLDALFAPNANPDEPLIHVGISSKDLRSLGLTPDDAKALASEVEGLSKQGLVSFEDVRATSRAINAAAKALFRPDRTPWSLSRPFAIKAGAKALLEPEGVQRALVDAAHKPRSFSARLTFQEFARKLAPDAESFDPGDPALASAFRKHADDSKQVDALKGLAWNADSYNEAEVYLFGAARDRSGLDKMVEHRRNRLAAAGQPFGIDAKNPRGLAAVRRIALASKNRRTHQDEWARVIEETSQSRGPLRSYAAALKKAIAAGDDTGKLAQIAEDIVFLRETAPVLITDKDDTIEQYGATIDAMIAERAATAPEAIAFGRRMIRMAVLAHWPMGGDAPELGYPGSHRETIEATLRTWGVDPELLQPELVSEVYRSLSAAVILGWRDDLKRLSPQGEGSPGESVEDMIEIAPFGSDGAEPREDSDKTPATGRRQTLRQAAADAIGTLVDELNEAEKLNLSSEIRLTGDTSRIPVDPSGLGYVRARLSSAHITQCLLESFGTFYRLDLRLAKDCKLGFEGGLHAAFGFGQFGSFNASAAVEASGALGSGVQLEFETTPEGRAALKDFLGKMIDGKKISASDWASAKTTYQMKDWGAKAGVNAQALLQGNFVHDIPGLPAPASAGGGLNANVTASAGASAKFTSLKNARHLVTKGEAEFTVGVSAGASLFLRALNGFDLAAAAASEADGLADKAPAYNLASYDYTPDEFASANASLTQTYTHRWKYFTDPVTGRYTSADRTLLAAVGATPVAAMSLVSNGPLRSAIKNEPDLARKTKALVSKMGREDLVSVFYKIKPSNLRLANDLLDEAAHLRTQGKKKEAAALRERSQHIIDAVDNYEPSTVSLYGTHVDGTGSNLFNLRFAKGEGSAEAKISLRRDLISFN